MIVTWKIREHSKNTIGYFMVKDRINKDYKRICHTGKSKIYKARNVTKVKTKMKYIAVILVAVGVVCSIASAQQYYQSPQQYQTYQQPAGQQYQSGQQYQTGQSYQPSSGQQQQGHRLLQPLINKVLNYVVQSVIKNVISYVVKLINIITPSDATFNIPTLASTLQALGNPNIDTLLTKVLALVTVDAEPVLDVVPFGLLEILVDGNNLLQYLLSQIPQGTDTVQHEVVENLIANYLNQLLDVITTQ